MAYQNRLHCFICNNHGNINGFARIDREGNVEKRRIALIRRHALERENIPVTDRTRICLGCNRSIIEEIEMMNNIHSMQLNVIFPFHIRSCIFCGDIDNLLYLSLESRIKVFIMRNIYIPENTKSCRIHTDETGLILQPLIFGLRFTERPLIVPGREMQRFFRILRERILDPWNSLSFEVNEEEYLTLTSLTKDQFNNLYTFCRPVPRQDSGFRYITKKDLLCFLCKIRQGISDEFLKLIFHYSSRQCVSLVVKTVLYSLHLYFVPNNIGFGSITHENYVAQHVPDFFNELYNRTPQLRKPAILIIDGTYAYLEKSSNFRELRQTYCMHKHEHLIKPIMIVAPDGYILAIHGPYFSDHPNNDGGILIDQFNRNIEDMRNWLQPEDIVLVDRGYRDSVPLLEELNIQYKMPTPLVNGQSQFTTEEANANRLVTKSRWVVESRNGHFRSKFKFFDKKIEKAHVSDLSKYFLVAGAIINRYHPTITMDNANVETAQRMLQKSKQPNIMQARVEIENLRRRRAIWLRLNHEMIQNFPRLSMQQLKDITFGSFQIHLARSYIQDKVIRDHDEEFQLDELNDEPGFITIRIYSRFRNRIIHQLWIAYDDEYNGAANVPVDEIVFSYYCTCQCGARTVGCCAHVTSVLWFLGYARHNNDINYPTSTILENVLDAALRNEELLNY